MLGFVMSKVDDINGTIIKTDLSTCVNCH
jgi:hypothetical protein